MSIFLFLKQIIDVFYNYKFGDYCMAVAALILILIQLWLNRPDDGQKIKFKILIPDVCIIILSSILVINMIIQMRSELSFQLFYVYGKIGSAILLYILGRLCYRRINECSLAILGASYIVVYSNLISRIVRFGEKIFTIYEPNGDLYYDDIDMAFSILMSMIFIAILGRNTIIKFITVFGICPFLIVHSTVKVQKVLMIVLLVILFIYMGERAIKRRKFTNFILPFTVLVMMIILAIIIAPVFTGNTDGGIIKILNEYIIGTNNIYGRYEIWTSMWDEFGLSGIKEMLIGKGLITAFQVENEYLAMIYSVGIIGTISAIVFVLSISGAAMKIKHRPTYYITVMLAILFLGTCMIKNAIAFTQMSWFVMMYFGMGAALSDNEEIM